MPLSKNVLKLSHISRNNFWFCLFIVPVSSVSLQLYYLFQRSWTQSVLSILSSKYYFPVVLKLNRSTFLKHHSRFLGMHAMFSSSEGSCFRHHSGTSGLILVPSILNSPLSSNNVILLINIFGSILGASYCKSIHFSGFISYWYILRTNGWKYQQNFNWGWISNPKQRSCKLLQSNYQMFVPLCRYIYLQH